MDKKDLPVYDAAIVGIVGLPARYGGFETLADHLVRRFGDRYRILVFCSRKAQPPHLSEYRGATLDYLPWDANGWQSIVYDAIAMLKCARRTRTLLVLGVSGCAILPVIRWLAPRTRIVVNIDGLEWKRRKWGRAARAFLKMSEAIAVRFGDTIIADNRGIQDHVERAYRRASTLIPYGGDNDDERPSGAPAERRTRFAAGSYFLTVCRIEPENNIEEILQAFHRTADAPLVIVGNWSVSTFATELRRRYQDANNIELLDPIYDASQLNMLRTEAKAYVHGHSAGGTNPSLVEAMHAGMAVFAYDVDYNRHTMGGMGWYWRYPSELAKHVLAADGEAIALCALRLRAFAAQHYLWDRISRQYEAAMFTRDTRVPPVPENRNERTKQH